MHIYTRRNYTNPITNSTNHSFRILSAYLLASQASQASQASHASYASHASHSIRRKQLLQVTNRRYICI